MRILNKLLGQLGFTYCTTCGSKLTYVGTHGWYDEAVWECKECKNKESKVREIVLDALRFDWDGVIGKYQAGMIVNSWVKRIIKVFRA